MKTQIIALESHDDLISVRDRMSWAKSPRILLVWPKFEKVTLRPVDLRILQQHAEVLGADLGVVTRRANVRRDAQGFGIPVFESSAAAQRDAWPVHSPKHHHTARASHPQLQALRDEVRIKEANWRTKPAVRVGFFALGVLAVLIVSALFVPRAIIKLTPVTKLQSITVPVTSGTSIQSVNITGRLPAHEVSLTVTGTQSAYITSQSSIPQDKASGIARFKNLTQSAITIPAGTVVYSTGPNPVGFVTQNDTHLPGNVNAIVEVQIIAMEAGAGGNLPANSLSVIDSSISLSASVTNPDPITGGSDHFAIAPSEDDHKRVHDVLISLLLAQAQQQISDSIGAKNVLLVNTLKMGQGSEETYDPPSGQPGNLLKLTMRVPFTAQYVSAEDLTQFSETILNAAELEGYIPLSSTLSYEMVGRPVLDGSGDSRFNLQVERTSVQRIDPLQVNALVRGLPPKSASKVLQTKLPISNAPEIDLNPAWWPWMPLIPFRITVQ
jgi:hypothetical protein